MSETRIRMGDVVAVTARVTGVRGDGSYAIEPLGFDYELSTSGYELSEMVSVEFYTVDEPKLVQHVWTRGDELFDAVGVRYMYDKPLGNGWHLLNRPDVPQHLQGAWQLMPTEDVAVLQSDPPEISGS